MTTTSGSTTQTVRLNGKRVRLTTRNGKVTVKAALPQEWELQAAQVRRLRAMPEYGKRFLLAGDQNAAKRGPRAQQEAIAAGLTPGEADLRIYLEGGRLRMIENKVGRAPLTESQKDRHPKLARLGHDVEIVRATAEDEAADKAEALVRGWLSANDNAEPMVPLKAVQGLLAQPAPHSPRRYIYDKSPERRIWANDKLDESIAALAGSAEKK